jgi:hypothetical protein
MRLNEEGSIPMREFFTGWRRRIGCITLLMAVVVTVAWVRSLFIGDYMLLRGYEILSQEGAISWAWRPGPSPFPEWFISIPLADQPDFKHFDMCVPYWPFGTSLTLLSCYLMLRPSRRSVAKGT